MACRRVEGLPFLPGNCYPDPSVSDFRRSQTLDCVNGFKIPKTHYLGVGANPIPELCQGIKDLFNVDNYDPDMIYGRPKVKCCDYKPPFANQPKCPLKFYAYTKETVNESPDENYRVRQVEIRYHLEDDTIFVYEPKQENSGLMQGAFIKRHQIPKNDLGETWNWKDLNLRCEVLFYGRGFRIVDADQFTKDFYESEGIILNDPEELPKDPYMDKRWSLYRKYSSNRSCDRRPKYHEYSNKPLKFYCVWDDRHNEYGELSKQELYFFLEDGTVEVKEVNCRKGANGRDIQESKLLLHRIRLPKDWKDLPLQFPLGTMEAKEPEHVEYYEAEDLVIGETISVFGRRFLIYDIDEGSKPFYRDHLGMTDFTPICIGSEEPPQKPPMEIPPWNGWGSPEDSMASVLSIVPKRPRVDDYKKLILELKVLKFGAMLDSTKPEDIGREFIISYRLVDDKISIYEKPVRNSGWPGGKFLDYHRILKPGSSKNDPEYYGPFDLYIGAMLDIFGHRFCIRCADRFVLEYAEKNPECFPDYVIQNLREYFECIEARDQIQVAEEPCDPGSRICEEPVGEGFFEHLGLGYGKSSFVHPCNENPNPNPCSYDWDMCRQMGFNCGAQGADDAKSPIDFACEKPSPGNPELFETPECAVYRPEKLVAPDPMLPNPKFIEDPQCVCPEDYYTLKDARFGCFNPPSIERQVEAQARRAMFTCPEDRCQEARDIPNSGRCQ